MTYMKTLREEASKAITPKRALNLLIEGNKRFINNLSVNRNLLQMVNETKDDQYPFAAILSCSDSRTSTELIFDQGLGDIFSIRLAGNIASKNAIASLEYACKFLGSKIIVVLGHTQCGAVKGACDNLLIGNFNSIFEHISPAIEAENDTRFNRNSSNSVYISNVMHLNIEYQIQTILDTSPLLHAMLENQEIGIVGGIYDISTGVVEFYDEDLVFDVNHQFSKIKAQIA